MTVRRRLDLPLLMTVGMLGGGFFALMALIMLLASLLGFGDYTLGNRPVSASEFWRSGAAFIFVIVGAWLGAVAVGFRRERRWARPLAAAYWFAMAALVPLFQRIVPSGADDTWTDIVSSCAFGLFALWYFYRKRSVVAYYAAVQAEQQAMPPSGQAGA